MSRLALAGALILLGALPLSAQETPAPSRARRAAQAGGSYAGNMGRFGGGIVVSEAARGAAQGDVDAVGDALRAPTSPEFLVGLALFDGSVRAGEALAARTPGLAGRLGGALKQNLVLAGALTVTSAVEVDLNGLSYGDIARGDLSDLEGARIGLGEVDAQSLGITAGAFAAAQPLWSGAKRLARRFGGAVVRRLATTAAIKAGLAVAPVPGSRVAAIGLTVVEVGLAVLDVAGLLTTAHALEQPIQQANDRRRRRSRVRDAQEAVAGARDPESLQRALNDLRQARSAERALAYLPAARQDLAMIRRQREGGADPARFDRLAGQALDDYGSALALPAQSELLLADLERSARTPAERAALERHRERVRAAQAEAAPLRERSYAEEARFYEQLAARTSDPELRALIEAAAAEVEAEGFIERDLRAPRTPEPQLAAAPRGGPAQEGIVDALRR